MDLLITLASITIFALPVGVMGAWFLQRAPEGIAGFMGQHRTDGWPLGIQEEDRDRPWGASPPRSRGSGAVGTVAGDPTRAASDERSSDDGPVPAPVRAVRSHVRLSR